MIAVDAQNEKRKFLSELGHELRNPMATILSSVELAKVLGMNAKETPELLTSIADQVRVMAILLDNFINNASVLRDLDNAGLYNEKKIPLVHANQSTSEGVLRILVVDDNETAADSMGQLLTLRGYKVEVAYSGAQGFQKALDFDPQVAILDIGMPIMDGYELVRMLHKEKFSCSYIALTGYGQSHDKENALLAGFDYHLTKPAGIKEIETILQKVAQETKK